jgi:hypothetical protein
MAPKLFGVNSPEDFLKEIERAVQFYEAGKTRQTRELLFIFLALNHLRDWIAPETEIKKPRPSNLSCAQNFYYDIYCKSDVSRFKTVNAIANGVKHFKFKLQAQESKSSLMADWDSLAEVSSLAEGVQTAHFIDDEPVEHIYQATLKFYKEHWFEK